MKNPGTNMDWSEGLSAGSAWSGGMGGGEGLCGWMREVEW